MVLKSIGHLQQTTDKNCRTTGGMSHILKWNFSNFFSIRNIKIFFSLFKIVACHFDDAFESSSTTQNTSWTSYVQL